MEKNGPGNFMKYQDINIPFKFKQLVMVERILHTVEGDAKLGVPMGLDSNGIKELEIILELIRGKLPKKILRRRF